MSGFPSMNRLVTSTIVLIVGMIVFNAFVEPSDWYQKLKNKA